MGIPLKNQKALKRMREAGRLVAETFALISENIKPGVTLRELDEIAAKYLKNRQAAPLYKGYRGSPPDHPPFPGVICASVNHEICHGLPDDRVLQDGDIVGIDIGLRHKGYCGDACVTFGVGETSAEAQRLMDITQECLRIGIAATQPGNHLNDIGRAIEKYAKTQGVSVVREWGGHGVGKRLHEPPSVPHIAEQDLGLKLRPGMVFTIEPMINLGTHEWRMLKDGWTVVTMDGALSAQFEHTVAITKNGTEILSQL